MGEYSAEFTNNVNQLVSEVDAGLSRYEARVQQTGQKLADTDFGRNFGNGLITSFERTATQIESRAKDLADKTKAQLSASLTAGTGPGGITALTASSPLSTNTRDLAREGIKGLETELKRALDVLPPELDRIRPQLVAVVRGIAESMVTSLRGTERSVARELRSNFGSDGALPLLGNSSVTVASQSEIAKRFGPGSDVAARASVVSSGSSTAAERQAIEATDNVFARVKLLAEQLGAFITKVRPPGGNGLPIAATAIPNFVNQVDRDPEALTSELLGKVINQSKGLATKAEGSIGTYGVSGPLQVATQAQIDELRLSIQQLVRFREALRAIEEAHPAEAAPKGGEGGEGGVEKLEKPLSELLREGLTEASSSPGKKEEPPAKEAAASFKAPSATAPSSPVGGGGGPLFTAPASGGSGRSPLITRQQLIDEANSDDFPGTHYGAPGRTSFSPSAPIFRQENGETVIYKGIPNIKDPNKDGALPAEVLNAEAHASAQTAYDAALAKVTRALKEQEAQLDRANKRASGEYTPIGPAIDPKFHYDQQRNVINRANEVETNPNELINAQREDERTTARIQAANQRDAAKAQAAQRGSQNPGPIQAFLGGLTSRGFEAPGVGLTSLFGTTGVLTRYAAAGAGITALYAGLAQLKEGIVGVNDAEAELSIALETTTAKSVDQSAAFSTFASAGVDGATALAIGTQALIVFQDEATNTASATELMNNTIQQSGQLAINAGIDIKQAAEYLTQATIGFQEGSAGFGRINDAITNAHQNYGGDTKDIAQGVAGSAAAARIAGVSPEELANIQSLVRVRTGDSGSTLSSGFNRLVARSGTGTFREAERAAGIVQPGGLDTANVVKLGEAYRGMGKQQRLAFEDQLAQSRSLPYVMALIDGSSTLVEKNAKSNKNAGASYEEFQKRMHSLGGELKQVGAALKDLFQNIGSSGAFDVLGIGLDVLKYMLNTVNQLLVAFRLIPGPIREIAGVLGGVYVLAQGIKAVQNTNFLRYIPGIPSRQAPAAGAAEAGAAAAGASRFSATAAGAGAAATVAAAGGVGAPASGRIFVAGTTEVTEVSSLATARANLAAQVAGLGTTMATEGERLAVGLNSTIAQLTAETESGIATFRAAKASEAEAILAAAESGSLAIRTAAQVEAAAIVASAEENASAKRAALALDITALRADFAALDAAVLNAAAATEAAGNLSGLGAALSGGGAGLLGRTGRFLGQSVGLGQTATGLGAARGALEVGGAGRLAAVGALGPIALAVGAGVVSYLAVRSKAEQIAGTERQGITDLQKPVDLTDLKTSAALLDTAAHNIGAASAGFLGTVTGGLTELFGGENRGAEKALLRRTADAERQQADALDKARKDPLSGAINSGASLDFSSPANLAQSLQDLVAEGRTATNVIDALNARLHQMNVIADTGKTTLLPGQSQEIAVSAGSAINKNVIDFAQLDREIYKDRRGGVTNFLRNALTASSGGKIPDTVSKQGHQDEREANKLLKIDQTKFGEGVTTDIEAELKRQGADSGKKPIDVKQLFTAARNSVYKRLNITMKEYQALDPKLREQLDLAAEGGVSSALSSVVGDRTKLNPSQLQAAATAYLQYAPQAGKDAATDARFKGQSGVGEIGAKATLEDLKKGKANIQEALKRPKQSQDDLTKEFQSLAAIDLAIEGATNDALDAKFAQMQLLSDFAVSGRPEGDKIGRIKDQLKLVNDELKSAKGDDKTRLEIIKNNLGEQEKDQDLTNAQSAAGVGVDSRDTVGKLQLAHDNALKAYRDAQDRHATGADLTGPQQAVQDTAVALAQGQLDDANSTRDSAVAVGDTVAQGWAAYADALDQANADIPNSAKQRADAKTAAELFVRNLGNQAERANAQIEVGIDSRDVVGEARGKYAEGVNTLNNLAPADYTGRLKQAKANADALNGILAAQASLTNAIAQAQVDPRDALSGAQAQMNAATTIMNSTIQSDPAYWQAYAQYTQGQIDLAKAAIQASSTAAQLHEDITDPIVQAKQAVTDALAQLSSDQAHPAKDSGAQSRIINADTLELRKQQNSEQKTTFDTQLQNVQDQHDLQRTSGAQYIQSLRALRASVLGNSYQAQQERIQIDKALKSAYGDLSGQFNLGDIKIPSVYEVRRSLAAGSAGQQFATTNTTSIVINGIGSTQEVVQIVKQQLGTVATSRRAPSVTRRV